MESIRIDRGTKTIEVNDQGETITLAVAEARFARDFYALVRMIEEESKKITEVYNNPMEVIDNVIDLEEKAKEGIDALIGEGTCRKVFGDGLPALDMIIEFFSQILPFVEEGAQKKVERMSKYSAARTGNV